MFRIVKKDNLFISVERLGEKHLGQYLALGMMFATVLCSLQLPLHGGCVCGCVGMWVYMRSRRVTLARRVFIVWAVFSILRYVRSKYPSSMILFIVEWQEE